MRVVAITRILDEADIVEAFVRHTAHYASHHIFVDNGSRDGTLEILQALKDEGFGITVFQNLAVAFNEVHFNTSMYLHAIRAHAADWVLCLDADEFIDDRGVAGGLGALFERLHEQPDALCLCAPLFEYRRARDDPDDEIVVPLRLRKRLKESYASKAFLSGRLAGPKFEVAAGNHHATIDGVLVPFSQQPGLQLGHYTDRSAYTSAAKWAKGWSKVLAGGPDVIEAGLSSHYKEPFRTLCDTPEAFFENPDSLVAAALHEDCLVDRITYRGGPLRYTRVHQDVFRSMRMVLGYLEELAGRYGRLVHQSAEARQIAHSWDSSLSLIIGESATGDREASIDLLMPIDANIAEPASVPADNAPAETVAASSAKPAHNRPTASDTINRVRQRVADTAHRFGCWIAPVDPRARHTDTDI